MLLRDGHDGRLGIVQAALIRNLGRPDWWFWYQAVTKRPGCGDRGSPPPLGSTR
jgi:hypothetical protein